MGETKRISHIKNSRNYGRSREENESILRTAGIMEEAKRMNPYKLNTAGIMGEEIEKNR